MENYSRTVNQGYPLRLNSLVMNPPITRHYRTSSYSQASQIPGLLTLPSKIKIDSAAILPAITKGIISLISIMLCTSILLMTINLPIQRLNSHLLTNTKRLTNENFELLAGLQEVTSVRTLFSKAESLSMKDSEETIYLSDKAPQSLEKEFNFNKKHPYMEFSGF